MRKTLAVLATALSILYLPSAAVAAGGMKQLGTDPALDGPAGADLIGLAVARHGSDLHIQIQLTNALPVQGSYPGAGIEWIFDVRGHTFVAEGHPEPGGNFLYTLFEIVDGSFVQKAILDGSFDASAGTLDMFVPLREIGARKGTRVSGTGSTGTEDVQIHQHAGPASPLLDTMATTEDFVVR